jgi:hypothetical protein
MCGIGKLLQATHTADLVVLGAYGAKRAKSAEVAGKNGGSAMRLIPKSRHHQRVKAPRISISQEEITADLLYPASPRAARQRLSTRRVSR